jgi:hypothetical protein
MSRRYIVVTLPAPPVGDPHRGVEHAVVRLENDSDPGLVECITWSSFIAAVIAVTLRRYSEAGVL